MSKPGSYRGKHFTSYVEEVEALLAFGRTPEDEARAERTLLSLIDATESEDKVKELPQVTLCREGQADSVEVLHLGGEELYLLLPDLAA